MWYSYLQSIFCTQQSEGKEMIHCKLRKIADDSWNISKLSRASNRSVNVIRSLWNDTAETYNRNVINDVCRVLNCTPGDLLEYIPDNPLQS